MNIKKITATLFGINILQFIIGLAVLLAAGSRMWGKVNGYIFLTVGFMLFTSLITIAGLYFASRYKNGALEESLKNLEDLNTTLRTQRHDYLNHIQVIYGLMELGEYEEAKRYLDPVFQNIMQVSLALKTAQPAVNALLQAKMKVAEQKKIQFYLEVRSDLKNITIEPWNLCKILSNILDNSITAISESAGSGEIFLEIGENANGYTFRICNNGPVIPASHLEKIFCRGYTTKKEQGHGLGLYIVAELVRESGGSVEVTSNTERTCFTLEMPGTQRLIGDGYH